jgi:hypothetical protein
VLETLLSAEPVLSVSDSAGVVSRCTDSAEGSGTRQPVLSLEPAEAVGVGDSGPPHAGLRRQRGTTHSQCATRWMESWIRMGGGIR